MKDLNFELEKIAYGNLWGIYNKNAKEDNLLEEMKSYIEDELNVKLFCDYKYGINDLDMDDSGKIKSPFIGKIYEVLWGKKELKSTDVVDKNGYTKFRKTFLFNNVLMGGETLNSLQSCIFSTTCSSIEKLSDEYEIRPIAVQNMLLKNGLGQNCSSNFYMGNYVMVPAYFNGSARGIQDRWVNRLPKLKNDWHIMEKLLSKYHDIERYKNRKNAYSKEQLKKLCEEQYYENYFGKDFSKYINTMFLWDYVCKDYNGYEIRSDENTNREYLWMCDFRIKRRSLFMTAMLKIAIEFPKGNVAKHSEWNEWDVSKIYKEIIGELYSNNCYAGYDEVFTNIDKLESVKNNSNVIEILRVVKELIDKLE